MLIHRRSLIPRANGSVGNRAGQKRCRKSGIYFPLVLHRKKQRKENAQDSGNWNAHPGWKLECAGFPLGEDTRSGIIAEAPHVFGIVRDRKTYMKKNKRADRRRGGSIPQAPRSTAHSGAIRGPKSRRVILLGATGFAVTAALSFFAIGRNSTSARAQELTVFRDPSCGCCKKWSAALDSAFNVKVVPSTNLSEVRQRLGVPNELTGCHTATVDGLVIEGHVPLDDIRRLLRERPAGIRGLAVPGMPAGSPGMETGGGEIEPYEVIAFGSEGQRLTFARYDA